MPWWEEPAADPVVGAQAGEAPAPQPTAEETDSADGVPADPERSEPLPATEAIPVLTDADLAAYDAARGDDTAEERRDAPGSALLPPLPPGVSDSSGWGPSWR